jgi:hypothetical protein
MKVHKNLQTQLYDQLSRTTLLPFWIKKERFSSQGTQQINWDALGAAMRQITPQQRQWITKRASRECGANYVLYKRKHKDTDKCPLCGEVETVLHIICCRDARATQQWDMSVQDFKVWLTQYNTDPTIITHLCNGLNQWRERGQVIPDTASHHLTIQQNVIGWAGVHEGCFSISWAEAQSLYFQQNNSRRTGFRWQVETC